MLDRSMRARPAAVLLSLFLAITASAADWPRGYDSALQRAKAEKKVILLHFRSACGICNRSVDKALIEAESHAPVTAFYDSFVRVRVNDGAIAGALEGLVAQDPPAPSMLIVDPNGLIVVPFQKVDNANEYLAFLNTAATAAPDILLASNLRASGKVADADHLLGAVLLRFNRFPEARDTFERAHAAYDRAGQHEQGELASIHADYVRCMMSDTEKNRGMSALLRATSSSSKEIAAAAWGCIGGIRKQEKDRWGAVRAFRKVLELVPGSGLAAGATAELEKLDDHPVAEKGTAATVTIVKPSRASITGRAQFSARVRGTASRVEFMLDDVRVQTVSAPQFQTRIDLGNVPRVHSIKAVAYDAAGNAIGEAVTMVNDRADSPRVTLVSPVAETVSGSVRVEADAQVPSGRTLKLVELFWNEARLAKFEQPPFRVEFEAPSSFGYFRAVATMDDGTTAEDTRVVNGGMSAGIDVHAIAFVATVVDRQGKRVTGLSPGDFVVRDEGQPVNAAIRESAEEPVTIGLVIDASGSMQTSMIGVIEMTAQFLDETVTPRDKVFIVGFAGSPWLLHPPSNDVASLKKSVLTLRASGSTAVVDGVAFGLQQFSGTTGKRALVVLTDGREGASSQTADAAIHLAKDTGIPVYGIVTSGQQIGNPLVNIANNTGGTMFFVPRRSDFIPMFDQIRDEVRGQYLISFIAAERGKVGEWRRLTVEVPNRDAKVRSVSGYFAR